MPANLLAEVTAYALSKTGARYQMTAIALPGVTWGDFIEVRTVKALARMPVTEEDLRRYAAAHPGIQRDVEFAPRDGHVYMSVPLNGSISLDDIKLLIDASYALIWAKLDARTRKKLQPARGGDASQQLEALIAEYRLSNRRADIHGIARGAVLLITRKAPEAKIRAGATKIGGLPDLPPRTPWPTYESRPLAFLAQLNLEEVAAVGPSVPGLSSSGLLSVFSAWGWTDDDGSDPQIRDGSEQAVSVQDGWNQVIWTAPDSTLERLKKPRGVQVFKSATVTPTAILSLPNHRAEPPLRALNWSDAELDRFDEMQSEFRSLQLARWLKNFDDCESCHQLGGYGLFQQEYPAELLDSGRAMLLQIGTDEYTQMCWGDAGELTFYADADALAQGRFERVWGTCQGG